MWSVINGETTAQLYFFHALPIPGFEENFYKTRVHSLLRGKLWRIINWWIFILNSLYKQFSF